ncbi:HflK protein [hydrothermal vent metagenome]|uniref:HflK protein n=1 Tax=hydrothermal vent metagenome TaxID=652676 RepID=A0A3B0TX62_9ZZZZ
MKRGRDQFKGELPGGRWLIAGAVVVALAFWLTQAVYTVAPQEIGVELLFGKPKSQLSEPGLHMIYWPFETVEKVTVTQNQTKIPAVQNGRSVGGDGLMLSGDQNIVDVSFSVLWRVADPEAYLFNVDDPADMVRKTAESAMREVVGRRPADDIFRDDKAGITLQVQQITQNILDSYGTGVTISGISIEQVAPPAEVADAFDEVQRAQQDEDRFQEEARQYSNTKLGGARGQAAQIQEEAAAYKDRVVKEAQGQAARFISVYDEYAKAPEVTRKRLYLETMEQVLGASNKVIIEKGAGSGVVPYLPLPEIKANAVAQGSK